jgi:hypothetical protein
VALDSGSGRLDNVETISTWSFFGHFFCYEKHIGVTWGASSLLRHGGALSSLLSFNASACFFEQNGQVQPKWPTLLHKQYIIIGVAAITATKSQA